MNGRPVGRATTDSRGVAGVDTALEGSPSTFLATATIDGQEIRGHGRIFHWDPNRTIVAVDVDDTISHTDYSGLFITRFDTTSPAFAHSPRVVQEMARRYHIIYVSARPRWLMEKTRIWLDRAGFPPGPVLHAPGFGGCFRQGHYKDKSLAAFQREFPSLLVGIGDKWQDDYAYGNRRMLGVILGGPNSKYRPHVVVAHDWRGIGEFFERHGDTLADARQLSTLFQANNMNLRPLFAGVKRHPARCSQAPRRFRGRRRPRATGGPGRPTGPFDADHAHRRAACLCRDTPNRPPRQDKHRRAIATSGRLRI